ncbi:SDR family oxidoreductase [Vampirovibrio sp.]|uniref:SDR family oxidoreductase n=1 Tax=Vampirovibrio sp. TaxID=2717857 RepID=UPI003593F4E4
MSSSATKENLQQRPAQHQSQKPGLDSLLTPQPLIDDPHYKSAGKLQGKVALITGGDSGIGSAIAVVFAKEGADVAVLYLNEHEDAKKTQQLVEQYGQQCLLISGDLRDQRFCQQAVHQVIQAYGKLDILINNAGEHWEEESIENLNMAHMEQTFQINIFSMFYLTQAAVPFLPEEGAIINTTSVTAYKGSAHLLDYSSTKGAIETFTYSLAQQLAPKKIRVNGVAPGPIWTPLIASTFSETEVQQFGSDVLMKRAGQPCEVATCYVFLASSDASYMTGQILHPNGGTIVHS